MAPPRTVGRRCTASSNDVTTPKFPPPPRRAQNRSGVILGRDPHHLGVGIDYLGRDEVVAGEARLHQVTDPAAECEPSKPGGRNQSASRRQAEKLGLAVELLPGGTALRPRAAHAGVNVYCPHLGQVEHQTVVAGGEPSNAMAAATYRDWQAFAPGEAYGCHDIRSSGTSR